MRRWMKKKGVWASGLVLVGTLVVMGWALWELEKVGGYFQCLWMTPVQEQKTVADGEKPTPNNASLREEREKAKLMAEQLEGACEHTALYAIASPAGVSVKEGGSAEARLEAIEYEVYALKSFELYGGRLIYPDEFDSGTRVAMVDEQLAVALFQYAEPLGREIIIAGENYRIVGIVRDQKQVGDQQDVSVYVPFGAIERSSLILTALCFQASPVPGSGGWAAFENAAKTRIAGCTVINLDKERMNAAMPVRMMGCVLAWVVLFAVLGRLNRCVKAFVEVYRQRLLEQYAGKLFPWLVGRSVLFVLAYAVCAWVFIQVFLLLIAPVYTFPEWIPAVLVEPKDIQTAFWNVWQGMAATVQIRSPQLIRIQFFARLLGWMVGCAGVVTGIIWGRIKR